MRPVPKLAVDFVKKQEGCILRVYDDKQPKKILKPGDKVVGVLTAGWGHTGNLKIGQVVTKQQAEAWLADDLKTKAAEPIYRKIGAVAEELTDEQFSALLSFVFNLGTGDRYLNGKFVPSKWTIWPVLRKRQFDQVPIQMQRFVNWNGKRSEALAARRSRETALWASSPAKSVQVPEHDIPSSVTRREDTPPTPIDPTPAAKSPTVITGALGVMATVPVAAKTIIDTVQPYQDAAPIIGQVIAVVASVAAASAVIVLALNWLKSRAGH